MNYRQLIAQIEDEAGVNSEELPLGRSVVWFPARTPLEVSLLYAGIPEDDPANKRPLGSKDREVKALFDGLKPTVFRAGQICPLNAGLTVVCVFGDSEEARVYCAALVPPGDAPLANPQPFTRYTLSMKSPTYMVAVMALDTFVSEAQAELIDLYTMHMVSVNAEIEEEEEEETEEKSEVGVGELPAGTELMTKPEPKPEPVKASPPAPPAG